MEAGYDDIRACITRGRGLASCCERIIMEAYEKAVNDMADSGDMIRAMSWSGIGRECLFGYVFMDDFQSMDEYAAVKHAIDDMYPAIRKNITTAYDLCDILNDLSECIMKLVMESMSKDGICDEGKKLLRECNELYERLDYIHKRYFKKKINNIV